ncbi:N-acetylmuramoyl-L-alanine amidase [Paenibacillus sp. UNC499MF]|uniref:N-acetylmuramoyl-L-alanine amidase family protein n=1 Tax=Paenibacillus sp. UNC499MF TaxID=1502751 RepID=UPI0008A08448|nr:N-acetylmuramoyl-L-alanine amidase [Paenibacillus sp. UNC499MF]SEG70290.1 N-acetylmuramoyl-L-alanine amidase [Paenibacillus sp. UNC499MF]
MKKFLIVIDFGHGGTDPGAKGNGLREKELTLEIGKRIGAFLGDRVDVRYTRTGDKFVDLSARAAYANSVGADYFLSVHINAGGGTGFESFVYTSIKAGSSTEKLRSIIHNHVAPVLARRGLRDRGRKSGDLAVLRQTNMPAVLLEYGFIDTAADAGLLKDDSFIDELARATADGLTEAFGLPAAPAPAGPDADLERALAKLHAAGVMDSPDFWAAKRAGRRYGQWRVCCAAD